MQELRDKYLYKDAGTTVSRMKKKGNPLRLTENLEKQSSYTTDLPTFAAHFLPSSLFSAVQSSKIHKKKHRKPTNEK
jgi:hypothetical protein